MENKLEQLLNSLIEKGWKPFGKINRGYISIDNTIHTKSPFFDFENHNMSVSTRELIAKESGLWQFVCDREHRFIDKKNYVGVRLDRRLKNPYVDYDGVNTEYEWITSLDYEYRLIESALKDESELEDFLLNSIKID